MEKALRKLIESGEDLLHNSEHEYFVDHVEDYYLKFTTKSNLFLRSLVTDHLDLFSKFKIIETTKFDKEQLEKILILLKMAECYFEVDMSGGFWHFLHPLVTSLAKKKFEQEHYADSVETVLKEINSIIKAHYVKKTGTEEDGASLMTRAFSVKNPIFQFADISTETGRNIQQGYMQIFAGSMIGIRNPKAHNNMILDKNKAMHLLFVTSFLALKLEDISLI